MVQRRAARWFTGRNHNTSSVSDMLRSLDWRSLEQRRVDSRLTILYKIRNHLVAIDENSYLQRGTGRRAYQYRQLRADKDYTRFSFFPRTVIQWNQLPSQSAWQSRSIPSRPKSRRSSTLDSIRPKKNFYLFAFLLLYFPLSFQFPTSLTHLFLYFYYHFPSRTPLVIILTIEGIPVYWQKQKQKCSRAVSAEIKARF